LIHRLPYIPVGVSYDLKDEKRGKETVMKALLSVTIWALALLSSSYTGANAAEWVHFATIKGTGDELYYDTESITSDGNDIVKVWDKRVPPREGKYLDASYTLTYNAINCRTREHSRDYASVRDTEGNVINEGPLKPSWEPIPPDSVMDSLYEAVCKGKTGG
jgi:hypothetical protein